MAAAFEQSEDMDAAADVATSHAPTGPAGHVKAVPIADYGFLSDGEVTALDRKSVV